MIKMETHIHTRYSKDSLLCFWLLYMKCRIFKISCVAITEHDSIEGAVQFKKFCDKRGNKIFVIVGEEIFTKEGEIIGLYLKENIIAGLSAEETICEIKRQNGIVYVPHPFDLKREKTVLQEKEIEKNRTLIDCIEVHNGRNVSKSYDLEQKKIAEKYNITPVVGSDAHTGVEIGRNYMYVEKIPLDAEEFKKVISSAYFHEKPCIYLVHKITKYIKVLKLLGKGNFNELYRIILKRIKRC